MNCTTTHPPDIVFGRFLRVFDVVAQKLEQCFLTTRVHRFRIIDNRHPGDFNQLEAVGGCDSIGRLGRGAYSVCLDMPGRNQFEALRGKQHAVRLINRRHKGKVFGRQAGVVAENYAAVANRAIDIWHGEFRAGALAPFIVDKDKFVAAHISGKSDVVRLPVKTDAFIV